MIEKSDEMDRKFLSGTFERHESIIPVSEIDFKIKYKDNCVDCPEYGNNFSCPPFSPVFDDFIGSREMAKIICLRTPLHFFVHLPEDQRARAAYDRMSSLLAHILEGARREGHLVAGAGACKVCHDCPVEKGGMVCIKPDEQVFSLESLGVNLSSLMERCFQIKLEWTESRHAARHICAVGAFFF